MGPVEEKIELLEEQTGTMDPKTSFRLIIVQTELERFKFLMRSFLRSRIAKVGLNHVLVYAWSTLWGISC